jgi:prophage regulatory protein
MATEHHQASLMADATLLRLPQVLNIIPVGRSTWWKGVATGRFPKPIRLGPRSVAWKAVEILTLVERLARETAESSHD